MYGRKSRSYEVCQFTKVINIELMRTDWYMRVRCDSKLLHDALRSNASFRKMAFHLIGGRLHGLVAGSNLYSMVFGLVWSNECDVRGDLAVFQL